MKKKLYECVMCLHQGLEEFNKCTESGKLVGIECPRCKEREIRFKSFVLVEDGKTHTDGKIIMIGTPMGHNEFWNFLFRGNE